MKLCKFSRSAIFRESILELCPLSLTANAAKSCPCKRRVHITEPVETRVATCNYPLDWRGKKYIQQVQPEALMSTATMTAPADEVVKPVASTAMVPAAAPHGSREIVMYDKIDNIPAFLGALADDITKSGVFMNCNPATAGLLAVECVARKQTPLQLAQTFHLIQGRLSMRADAVLAEFNRMGGKHQLIEKTADKASAEFTWEKKKYVFSITWEEAKTAPWPYGKEGQLKDNWAHPLGRKAMLWARMVSDAVRTICPSVNCGRYTPEEIADFGDAPQVVLQQVKKQEAAVAGVQKAEAAAEEAGYVDAEFTAKDVEVPVEVVAEEEPPFDITPIEPPKAETPAAEARPTVDPLAETPDQIAARSESLKQRINAAHKALGMQKPEWLKVMQRGAPGKSKLAECSLDELSEVMECLRPAYESLLANKEWRNVYQWTVVEGKPLKEVAVTPGK